MSLGYNYHMNVEATVRYVPMTGWLAQIHNKPDEELDLAPIAKPHDKLKDGKIVKGKKVNKYFKIYNEDK